MTVRTRRLISVTLMALLLAGSARAEEGDARTTSDPCGRSASLEAAKEALARGERAKALEHLRRAEARLDACPPPSKEGLPDESGEAEEVALAFGAKTQLALPLS